MEPIWITTLVNIVTIFLMLVVPVIMIAFGVSIAFRPARRETSDSVPGRAYDKGGRILLAVVAIVVGLLWLFLSFNMAVLPGQSPVLVVLPVLLIILAQISFWVLVIAGGVWLVLWLARRMGVVGPAREAPLDILKGRYARGEISKAQFEELRRDLG